MRQHLLKLEKSTERPPTTRGREPGFLPALNLRLFTALRAAFLLLTTLLFGCATKTTHPADGQRSRGLNPVVERPGLGTAWGEQRESWVEPAAFVRDGSGKPAARGSIFYNDRDGAAAMLAFLGGDARRCDGFQPVQGGQVRAGLRGGDGAWLECSEARGRKIASGERGSRYEVVLKNDARRPVEVVVSVDGLDVMDGKAASPARRGYVLAPFETLAIAGFRTSRSTVAAFHLGPMFGSYAQRRHGSSVNAGIVGIAVFEEKRRAGSADAAASGHAWRASAARPQDPQAFALSPEA